MSANASKLTSIDIDEGARAEIQQALIQGLEVTVHQSPITVNGWTGSGYSIIDPDYGAGAYKITGGASGGELLAHSSNAVGLLLKVLGFFESLASALNGALKGPFGSILDKLGKVLPFLSYMAGLGSIASMEGCSGGDVYFLIFQHTLWSVLQLGLAFGAVAIGLPIMFAFLMITLVSVLVDVISSYSSGLTSCRSRV